MAWDASTLGPSHRDTSDGSTAHAHPGHGRSKADPGIEPLWRLWRLVEERLVEGLLADTFLIENVVHHPLDRVKAERPDRGPNPGSDNIVGASDDRGGIHGLSAINRDLSLGEERIESSRGQGAELAIIDRVGRECVPVESKHGDERGAELGAEEGNIGPHSCDRDPRECHGTDDKHQRLSRYGDLQIEGGPGHGSTDILLLGHALVQGSDAPVTRIKLRLSQRIDVGDWRTQSVAPLWDKVRAPALERSLPLVQGEHAELVLEEGHVGHEIKEDPR
mmetsp:Transcript_13068/g.37679  ORF Transcript_13068/g.37679 Transcript_13068/m.37679 type:complete len:277 (+) Transcript_13068:1594-2424(+)